MKAKKYSAFSIFKLPFSKIMTFPKAACEIFSIYSLQEGERFAVTVKEANLQILLMHHFHYQ